MNTFKIRIILTILALKTALLASRPLQDRGRASDTSQKELDCAELLFKRRLELDEAAKVTQAASDILNGRLTGTRLSPRMDPRAIDLIRMATGVQLTSPITTTTLSPIKRRLPPASADDEDYDPRTPKKLCGKKIGNIADDFTQEQAKKIVEMADVKKWSPKTIQKNFRKYQKWMLARIRKIAAGESTRNKQAQIDQYVAEQFAARRNPGTTIVRGWMLRNWAGQKARELGHDFKASDHWLRNFKNRHGIGSRKITDKIGRSKMRNAESIDAAAQAMRIQFTGMRHMFRDRLILNFDQSGFAYEISADRTLSYKGESDTILRVDQANKATHSYTVLPLISREGRAVGKLLICLQESGGRFGPRVSQQVAAAEQRLGNIVVQASASGKMSTELMTQWIQSVLLAYIDPIDPLLDESSVNQHNETADEEAAHVRLLANELMPSEVGQLIHDRTHSNDLGGSNSSRPFYQLPRALIVGDSWTGQTNYRVRELLRDQLVDILVLPPGTTGTGSRCQLQLSIRRKVSGGQLHQECVR